MGPYLGDHSGPRHVPYEARMAAEFLAHMLSLLTSAKEDADGAGRRLRMTGVIDQLVESLCREPDLHASLGDCNRKLNLLSLLDAQGAAVVSRGGVSLMGVTPPEAEVRQLAAWLVTANQPVFATDRLSEIYPPGAAYKSAASGVLAARLSSHEQEFLLWFRPEHIRHLPVKSGDRLVGIISSGDVLKHRLGEMQLEANVLRDYAIARR
jgi:chemotaxis family two-component system sensor kinase Cph1